jgi:hypothetical protein
MGQLPRRSTKAQGAPATLDRPEPCPRANHERNRSGGRATSVNQLMDWLDDFQRRHALVGFPFAVAKKFDDDRAGNLAALIAYYGFFSASR